MFTVAAQTLAGHVDQRDLDEGALFPPLTELREITRKIAIAVVKEAQEQGVGRGLDDAAIPAAVDALVWEPHYPKLIPV